MRFFRLFAASTLALTVLAGRPAAGADSPPVMTSWLETAVFYEIYPQTFSDSNGDGIGDLPGIIAKLPYLHGLGVTALWLNPCFMSPFRDAGYDVADFYQVAPRYGTNDDLRRLCTEAHRLGIRLMLDLVAGHTSDQHPWFRESQRHPRNRYTDWYIWTDSVWTWSAPGQQVVVGAAERDANYIPNFFYFQPALNYGYAHPDPKAPWQQPVDAPGPQAVRAELKQIMRFWFDLGVDGFRVDMAGSLVKNDTDGRATAALWHEFRAWMDREYPDRVMVSEWSVPQVAIPGGFHMDFLLPYNKPGYTSLFRPTGPDARPFFDRSGRGDIRKFIDEFEPLYAATKGRGFIASPTGNHDTVPRLGDGRDSRDLDVAFAFLLTMPGVPFIYYGDELGMTGRKPDPDLRTPMQWTGAPGAGFSAATPWHAVNPDYARCNVATESADDASLLSLYRRLIRLNADSPALRRGEPVEVTTTAANVYAAMRQTAGEVVLLLANFNPAAMSRPVVSAPPTNLRTDWRATSELGAEPAAPLVPAADGSFHDWVPVAELPGQTVTVIRWRKP